ncbi:hypothetical protein AALO_G00239010 [Alosa alosa]|uniref:Uncharacterized protein n=1 Tax=Alosa alosa TaxID=278164 RepID=A0AAV6FW23_9TELE|nr:hypothetical protein AALO_G00239010 [Alosa alosa]
MLLFFREEWEMEGLQTVGILLVICSSLKLLHFLGLIDFSTGEEKGKLEMLLFFREEWEMEGLQTVGILLVICSSLKLLHFLGLIDFSTGGKR